MVKNDTTFDYDLVCEIAAELAEQTNYTRNAVTEYTDGKFTLLVVNEDETIVYQAPDNPDTYAAIAAFYEQYDNIYSQEYFWNMWNAIESALREHVLISADIFRA